jgi:hypothetical protein
MVFVDKATKTVAAYDRTSGFGLPDGSFALWDSKIETAMRPLSVAVVDVHLEYRFETTFVHDEDPVEALGPDRPNEPLRISIGPWSTPWSSNDLDTSALKTSSNMAPNCLSRS